MSAAAWLNSAGVEVARKLSQRSAKRGRSGAPVIAERMEDRVLMSTTVLAANGSPVYGATVTFTATVTNTPQPTDGTVSFYDTTTDPLTLTPLGGSSPTVAGDGTATSGSITLDNGISATDTIEAIYSPGIGDVLSGIMSSTSNTVAVTKAPLTVTVTGANKTYDGGLSDTLATFSPTSGVVPSDDVSVTSGTATFASASVANSIVVTATSPSIVLGGTTAGDYSVTTVVAGVANITKAPLTVTVNGAAAKIYDGTTAAPGTSLSITSGKFNTDDVSIASGTATFASAGVGTAVPVTVSATSIVLGGLTAGDYSVTTVVAGAANITVATPTIVAIAPGGGFTGSAYAATAGIKGVSGSAATTLEGVPLTGVSFTYSSGSAPSAVGTYTVTVTAHFAGSANYAAVTATSAPTTFTISPVIPGHVIPGIIKPIVVRPTLPTLVRHA